MSSLLVVILVFLLLLLGWIGWRFFVANPASQSQPLTGKGNAAPRTTTPIEKKIQTAQFAELNAGSPRRTMVRAFKNARFALASFLLIAIVVIVTLKLNALHVIAPFLPQQYGQTAHIQDTLAEAKLVPPSALPPEVFINATQSRPSLAGANRDWSRLESGFMQQVLQVMKRMNERGYPLALLEGYRSPERQDDLAKMAVVVTKANGGQSKHQYGWAVDLAPIKNGKVIISEKDEWANEAYQALGQEAQALGLTWGGHWSFKDYGHIEKPGSLSVLLQKNQ